MSTATRIDDLRKKFEDNPRRYFAPLANEHRKAGELAQAIALCREHLPKQPGHMSGYIVFGQALFESGELTEARDVFEQALDLDPENLIALRHLGDIAQAHGDLVGARRWFERVLDADPRNDDIAAQLATLSAARTPRSTPVAAPNFDSVSRAGVTQDTPVFGVALSPTPDSVMRAVDMDAFSSAVSDRAAGDVDSRASTAEPLDLVSRVSSNTPIDLDAFVDAQAPGLAEPLTRQEPVLLSLSDAINPFEGVNVPPEAADIAERASSTAISGLTANSPEDVADAVTAQGERNATSLVPPSDDASAAVAPTHSQLEDDFGFPGTFVNLEATPTEVPKPAAAQAEATLAPFEDGLLAVEWPDTADLVARVITPRSATPQTGVPRTVTPMSSVTIENAISAFGRELTDASPSSDLMADDFASAFVQSPNNPGADAPLAELFADVPELTGDVGLRTPEVDLGRSLEDSFAEAFADAAVEAPSFPDTFVRDEAASRGAPAVAASNDPTSFDETVAADTVVASIDDTAMIEDAFGAPIDDAPLVTGVFDATVDDASLAAGAFAGAFAATIDDAPVPADAFGATIDDAPVLAGAVDATPDDAPALADTFDTTDDASDVGAGELYERAPDVVGVVSPETLALVAPAQDLLVDEHSFAITPIEPLAILSDDLAAAVAEDVGGELEADSHLHEGDAESRAFVTETMGELLVAQGLKAQAIDVYEELVRKNPGDLALMSRLGELQSTFVPAQSELPTNVGLPHAEEETSANEQPTASEHATTVADSGSSLDEVFSLDPDEPPVAALQLDQAATDDAARFEATAGGYAAPSETVSEVPAAISDTPSASMPYARPSDVPAASGTERSAHDWFASIAARRVTRQAAPELSSLPPVAPPATTPLRDDAPDGLSLLFSDDVSQDEDVSAKAFADAFGPSSSYGLEQGVRLGFELPSAASPPNAPPATSDVAPRAQADVPEPQERTAPATPYVDAGSAAPNGALPTSGDDGVDGNAGFSFDKFFPDPALRKPTPLSTAVQEAPVSDDMAQFSAWLKGLGQS